MAKAGRKYNLDDDWIDSREAAAILGVPPVTLRSWVHRGVGPPYYRMVQTIRYKRAEVEAWLAASRVGPK